jgi:pseudouridine-5'-phosphate glycosidase
MAAEAFRVAEEVADALAGGKAVVALESTLIAHGLPAPHNLETARAMAAAVRRAGAVPATVAVIGGTLTVGIDDAAIAGLAQADGVRKASRRDLAIAVARRETAATTVAGTLFAAARAGIAVFATGGIGGVHRGSPHDVSADLAELGRAPLAVVCSGPKSILDVALTREVLETQGVAVIGYGTDEMAGFYVPGSGLAADGRVDTPDEAARLILARDRLGLDGAILITVPVPAADALGAEEAEAAIAAADAAARRAGIAGAALTPFVLAEVARVTAGRSLAANRALLVNNAGVAGAIAVALAHARTR